MKSFFLAWLFTFILWGIIYLYFVLLGALGKIATTVDKKIPGTKDWAFILCGAMTWYLACSMLFGFSGAAIFNFTILYLGLWGSLGLAIINIFLKIFEGSNILGKGKAGMYILIGFMFFWILLAIDLIGPVVRFIKSFL